MTSLPVSNMPGVESDRSYHESRLVGSLSSISWLILESIVEVLTSTTGAAPVTVTVSSIVPIGKTRLTVTVSPAVKSIFSCTTVLKLGIEAVRRIFPGGQGEENERPFRRCDDGPLAHEAGPVISTATPGRASPLSSVIVPVIFPSRMDWARTTATFTKARHAIRMSDPLRIFFAHLLSPLLLHRLSPKPCLSRTGRQKRLLSLLQNSRPSPPSFRHIALARKPARDGSMISYLQETTSDCL